MKLHVELETWPRKAPLRISGFVFDVVETVRATVTKDGVTGQAEASGIYYKGETARSVAEQIMAARASVEAGISRGELASLLPAGGARNAIDCALWDLEAKLTGVPVWKRAGLPEPSPILTAYTIGANDPATVASTALAHVSARALKLKLTGDGLDVERVQAARSVRPDVWIGVDANQGFDRRKLEDAMPAFVECDVKLIEQPFGLDQDAWLDDFDSPIPIAADESVQTQAELEAAVGRFDVVNIKLDKAGGFTEALHMLRRAQQLGLRTMVGNMMGTSLAMAPAYLLGQNCEIVDLDGPMFLRSDRSISVRYDRGMIHCPARLWGIK